MGKTCGLMTPHIEEETEIVEQRTQDDREATWDEAAIKYAWLVFRAACSDFIYEQMGPMLHKRHNTSITVPRELLESMRQYGRWVGVEDKSLIYTSPKFNTCLDVDRAASAAAAKRAQAAKKRPTPSLRDILDELTKHIATYHLKADRVNEQKAAEAAAKEKADRENGDRAKKGEEKNIITSVEDDEGDC